MKSINKQYVLGFALIFLLGVGLIIGGGVRYALRDESDLIETQGYVVGVETRIGENGTEYRPFSVRYYVEDEDNYRSVSVSTWFSHPIRQGDAITVYYKKSDPDYTVVSNTDPETLSFALMGIGGVLSVAGIVLLVKYLIDVKRGKKVTA